MITRTDTDRIAHLSRLSLSETESETFVGQLNSILAYVEQLNNLDTASVVPTSHVIPLQNVTRDDVVRPQLPRTEALRNAPDATERFYRVPKIIE